MDYSPIDAMTDAGKVFMGSFIGGIAAEKYLQRGQFEFYVFAVVVVLLLAGFILIMEKNRHVVDENPEETEGTSGGDVGKRIQNSKSPSPSMRYER